MIFNNAFSGRNMMNTNPVIEKLGRPLRLALIGGGPGSFIGPMHRRAAGMDGRYEICAGVLSSDPEKAASAGRLIGLDAERTYANAAEMIQKESERKDGAEVIAIMTPNDSHYDYACAALDKGFDVICDKPMTNTLENAENLHKKITESGLVFCLTHNYTGYPMVRQAKAMNDSGDLGETRLVQVEYVQGGKAASDDPDPADGPLPWRYDPVKGGPSLVMGDIGTHAHNLLRFITGLEVAEVCAEIGNIVPGRLVHDYAGALLRLSNGARGNFWVTQAAAGIENCLSIRVSGSKASIEWMQEIPQVLHFKPIDSPAQIRTPNGPGTLPLAARVSRIVKGHPEGFPESFANIYSDAAEAVAARITGTDPDPLAMHFPNSLDGLKGVRFVHKVIESSDAGGKWVKV